jgi:D-alanyl-D-alanine dipeptidase
MAEQLRYSDDASGFVRVKDIIPDVILDIRYDTDNNFMGRRIDGYEEPEALLTREAAEALKQAADEFRNDGLLIRVYDAYRPQKAVSHFMRWAADPDDACNKADYYPDLDKQVLIPLGFIAEHSGHTRGSTIDMTLCDAETGIELDMGGPFDFFGELSHPDYKGVAEQQYQNGQYLRNVMMRHGFLPLAEEWWHFSLKDEPYPDTYFTFPVSTRSLQK